MKLSDLDIKLFALYVRPQEKDPTISSKATERFKKTYLSDPEYLKKSINGKSFVLTRYFAKKNDIELNAKEWRESGWYAIIEQIPIRGDDSDAE